MKKMIFLIFAALCFTATSAFAAYGTGTVTLGSTNTKDFKTSKNVFIDYTAGTNGVSYVVGAYHNKGSKTFGSCSGAQVIYVHDGTATATPAAPADANTTSDFSGAGWDEM